MKTNLTHYVVIDERVEVGIWWGINSTDFLYVDYQLVADRRGNMFVMWTDSLGTTSFFEEKDMYVTDVFA